MRSRRRSIGAYEPAPVPAVATKVVMAFEVRISFPRISNTGVWRRSASGAFVGGCRMARLANAKGERASDSRRADSYFPTFTFIGTSATTATTSNRSRAIE